MDIIERAFAELAEVKPLKIATSREITVAVMGCEVNGPKEAKHAQFGIAGTPSDALLFRGGKTVGEYSFDDLPGVLPKFLSGSLNIE